MNNPAPAIEMLKDAMKNPQAFSRIKHIQTIHKHDGMTCADCGKLVAEYSHQTGERFCACEIV